MESTVSQEEHLAGTLKYVQFTSCLCNFIEKEILSDGWQSSAGALERIIPKKKYLPDLNKALHGAIIAGFEDFLKEVLDPLDLPNKWAILHQERNYCNDHGKNCGICNNSKMALLNLKLKHKNALKSIIELKLQKIENIKHHICSHKVAVSKKTAELQSIKEKHRKNSDVLEHLSSMSF